VRLNAATKLFESASNVVEDVLQQEMVHDAPIEAMPTFNTLVRLISSVSGYSTVQLKLSARRLKN